MNAPALSPTKLRGNCEHPPPFDSWYKETGHGWSEIEYWFANHPYRMLRLTKKTDYGLIALKHLASRQRESNESVSAKDVAETYGIPLPLLAKILQKLVKNGFISSEQGTNGGYRLSRPAALISTLEVIRAIEGPVVLASCFTDHARCGHSDRCSVKRPLQRIHEEILRLLRNVTVEDMLDEEGDNSPGSSAGLIALQPLMNLGPGPSAAPMFDSVRK